MPEHARITEPAQLEDLPLHEQAARLRPLLQRALLTATPDARARHEENLHAAVAILASAWATDPTLDRGTRRVDFGDYLAARLWPTLRELDAEQQPERYDAHRAYQPDEAPLPLEDHDEPAVEADVDDRALFKRLGEGMAQAGIASAAHPEAMRRAMDLLQGVAAGSIMNGRQAAKALGEPDYKTHPATKALHAAEQIVDQNPDQTFIF